MENPDNSLVTLHASNLVLSVHSRSAHPSSSNHGRGALKLCVGGNVYDVGVELSDVVAPFGIDRAFGKHYMKLTVRDPVLMTKLSEVDERVRTLVQPSVLHSCVTSFQSRAITISTLLCRNVTVVDAQNQPVSLFAIQKGSSIALVRMVLGDVYDVTGGCTYKWIVKHMVVLE